MSYRVFARKYRPSVFEEVIGQEHVTRTLQNAIAQNRIAQAYLLVGPRGIGKTSTARILAKALNCIHGPTATPCNQCDACREIAEGNCLDVLEIDGASNNSVEHIRELRESAAYAPARGPFKVYLIDEVHMLSTAAFNALLKTLEEPPAHVKFIFATTEAQKVPATITSRCQRFDLRRIAAPRMAEHLLAIAQKEEIHLDADAAQAIARGADGGLRDAESMLDQVVAFCGNRITTKDVLDIFGFTSKEVVVSLGNAIFEGNPDTALKIVADQSEAGKDLSRLLADFIVYLRDILVSTTLNKADSTLPSTNRILSLLDHFVATEARIRWAPDRKLHLDVAVIKAIYLLQQVTLDEVLDTLTDLREGNPVQTRPPLQKEHPTHIPLSQSKPQKEDSSPPSSSTSEEESPPVSASEKISSAPAPAVAPPSLKEEEKAKAFPHPVAEEDSMEKGSDIWNQALEKVIQSAPLKGQWLKSARLVAHQHAEFTVEFPPSLRDGFQFVWQRLQGELEAELTRLLNVRARVTASIGDFEEHPEETGEASQKTIPPESETPPSERPPIEEHKPASSSQSQENIPSQTEDVESEEEFKNDPLIQKALELFKSEQQLS